METQPETSAPPDQADLKSTSNGAMTGPTSNVNHWLAENQTLALLGSFAVGVFIGVLLRR